ELVLRLLGFDLFPRRELLRLETYRDVEQTDVEHGLVLEEVPADFSDPRRTPNVLNEFDRLPRDEKVPVVSALDSECVQTMAVSGDRNILAELEEDGVHGLSALFDGRG